MTPVPRKDGDSSAGVTDFKSASGFKRIGNATLHSLSGLAAAWRYEYAFRQELFVVIPLVVIACVIEVGAAMRALMIGSLLAVLMAELLNSAIEAAVDRISLDRHPLAARAKDLGSAAVFIAISSASAIWLVGLCS